MGNSVIITGISDSTEPYSWVPTNNVDVLTFALHVNSLTDRSLTVTFNDNQSRTVFLRVGGAYVEHEVYERVSGAYVLTEPYERVGGVYVPIERQLAGFPQNQGQGRIAAWHSKT